MKGSQNWKKYTIRDGVRKIGEKPVPPCDNEKSTNFCRSCGSYSYWPPSTSLQEHQNLRANVDSVFFAGEATSQEFFGYLHGAYYEGKHVAEFLAPCLNMDPDVPWCQATNYQVLTGVTPYDLYNPVNGWYIYNDKVPGHD